jgi:hypothetical protein
VPFTTVLYYGLLNLPYQLLQIAPFVTLFAGMFTVNRLMRKNEVVAVLSAGVSVHRLLLPVYIGGVVIALAMFALREGVRFGFAEERDALEDMLGEQRHERVIENLVVRDVWFSTASTRGRRVSQNPEWSGSTCASGRGTRIRASGHRVPSG